MPRKPRVGLHPQPHAVGHEADGPEASKQIDHPGDVVRVVARVQQPAPRDREVGKRLFELDPRRARARKDARLLDVAVEMILVARLRVLLERLDGCLLRVRPDALGTDVRAYAADHLQARRAEREQQHDDRDERPDQPEQAPVGGLRRGGRLRHGARASGCPGPGRAACGKSKAWAIGRRSGASRLGAAAGP